MDSPTKHAIQIVKDYAIALDILGVSQGYSLERLSYSKYAADELLKCLKKQDSTPPLLVIENFRDRMDAYSHLNEKSSFVFSVARDVAGGIVDELISQ